MQKVKKTPQRKELFTEEESGSKKDEPEKKKIWGETKKTIREKKARVSKQVYTTIQIDRKITIWIKTC